jgi:hypothetical protein
MKERRQFMRPDWVRVEAQVRPGKAVEKAVAAKVSALDAWGWSAWSLRAAERLCQVEVQRFAAPAESPEFDRTTLYLARAFRRHLEELLVERGSWLCIGRELEQVWAKDDAAQEATQARRRRAQ